MRQVFISSQWQTGKRMSAAPEVGECHRFASKRKSSLFRASQLYWALAMFMWSPEPIMPPWIW